jgi:methionyl-tRNA formyltransferase
VRKVMVRTNGAVMGPAGTIATITEDAIAVNTHGGRIEILVVRPEGGAKLKAAEFAKQQQLAPGLKLGAAS